MPRCEFVRAYLCDALVRACISGRDCLCESLCMHACVCVCGCVHASVEASASV